MKLYKAAYIYSAFNQGYSLTSPIKWIAATIGLGAAIQDASLWWIVLGAFFYLFLCIIVGVICLKKGWNTAVKEVENKNNLFVEEMRATSQAIFKIYEDIQKQKDLNNTPTLVKLSY